MSKSLSPEAALVARAIEAMDALVAKGWTYSWFAMYDRETKRACLGGALIKRRWKANYGMGETVSHIAHEAHWTIARKGNDEDYTDYTSLRAALLKKYNLADPRVMADA